MNWTYNGVIFNSSFIIEDPGSLRTGSESKIMFAAGYIIEEDVIIGIRILLEHHNTLLLLLLTYEFDEDDDGS